MVALVRTPVWSGTGTVNSPVGGLERASSRGSELPMWISILAMLIALSLEAFRIDMTLLVLSRPKPSQLLLAWLSGGGTTVGLVVLFLLQSTLEGSTQLTLTKVKILVGLLVLLAAAVVATQAFAIEFDHRDWLKSYGGRQGGRSMLPAWSHRLVKEHSLWFASISVLGIALPAVDYLDAQVIMMTASPAWVTKVPALLTFNVLALALVVCPIVADVTTPEKVRATITWLGDCLRSRPDRAIPAILAGVGYLLLTVGAVSL